MDNAIYDFEKESAEPLHRIGAGSCGSVWSETRLSRWSIAIKREDGEEGRSLENDSDMHQRLLAAYRSGSVGGFQIPKWYGYISTENARGIAHRFPVGYTSCNILLTERILPLPGIVRSILIMKDCPPACRCSISNDPKNAVCLVRPYLGKRRRTYNNSKVHAFSLRNFPLHINQMEELGLDTKEYSLRMAKALAFMHWSAKVDANDVEFVLAPTDRSFSDMYSSALGDHSLWILDFNYCRPMTMDVAGLHQAMRAFWRNDPFYPRPGSVEERDRGL
ncbi:hypothetical protein F5B21DRAFT_521237 [Xylaria acuta]|nr:hypothetical protein F5B21DRAFT_521237 [Xylaria acuta]